jgi:plastocyanin domain-containing protein
MRYERVIALSLWIAAGCGGKADDAKAVEGPVTMEVTEAGYVPASFKVKKGVPVELLITRKTDATCAKEIVIDEPKVNTPLPLNTQVRVSFTPEKSGQLKFGCAMDKMISGTITVE